MFKEKLLYLSVSLSLSHSLPFTQPPLSGRLLRHGAVDLEQTSPYGKTAVTLQPGEDGSFSSIVERDSA